MPDFLLELRSEEIPARMQAGARAELEKLFRRELEAAGVVLRQAQDERSDVTVWSTPRRLALIARGLPDATEAVSEQAKGPPEGAPEAALEGFCRKNGVTKDQLQLREVKGRQTWFAVIERPGRATKAVLADAIPAIVRDFAWPKSMRWGAASLSTESARWVRPLSGIVAILGEDLIACEAADVASGYATLGHRFHHPGPITIGGAHDYAEKLRACHVIVAHEERAALIREGAAKAAAEAGLTLVEDEGLVVENAGLTEWPVPLLGRFDEAFLDVPPEVIQLTARVNQKYFVCTNPPLEGEGDRSPQARGGGVSPSANGDTPPSAAAPLPPPLPGEDRKLANAFVCTANIAPEDGGAAIVEGNRKVLAARLSDARFFWEQDRRTTLADHAKKLERITFHEKLGTVADKVVRVAGLARWLVEEGIVGNSSSSSATNPARPEPVEGRVATVAQGASTSSARAELADLAERAARLAKADLVTEMVGEFPELQGVMGGHYARAEGLDPQVADAIRDHYKPVGQGDEVATAPVTVALSLADKLDTLVSFFGVKERPSGSRDPFALRRAAIAMVRIIIANDLRFELSHAIARVHQNIIGVVVDGLNRQIGRLQREEARLQAAEELTSADGKKWHLPVAAEDYPSPANVSAIENLRSKDFEEAEELRQAVLAFLTDRLKVQQREAGVRHDLIDAVFALGQETGKPEDDLVRLLARVKALQHYIETAAGADLLAAYKRAANILKKEGWATSASSSAPLPEGEGLGVGAPTDEGANTPTQPSPERGRGSANDGIARTGEEDPLAMVDDPDMAAVIKAQVEEKRAKALSYTPEDAETALIAALDSAEPKATVAVEAEDFAAAMSALASLRAPIDRFFDEVTVNDPDSAKRAARLGLLARFRDAVHRVADFSRIEG